MRPGSMYSVTGEPSKVIQLISPEIGQRVRFRSTIPSVEVLRSALRHDVEPEDIQHAVRNALVVEEIAEDPVRYLLLGADRAGRFLELVVMDRPQGPAVIHAMPMRARYRTLLPKGR
jgi:hypothetical protein